MHSAAVRRRRQSRPGGRRGSISTRLPSQHPWPRRVRALSRRGLLHRPCSRRSQGGARPRALSCKRHCARHRGTRGRAPHRRRRRHHHLRAPPRMPPPRRRHRRPGVRCTRQRRGAGGTGTRRGRAPWRSFARPGGSAQVGMAAAPSARVEAPVPAVRRPVPSGPVGVLRTKPSFRRWRRCGALVAAAAAAAVSAEAVPRCPSCRLPRGVASAVHSCLLGCWSPASHW